MSKFEKGLNSYCLDYINVENYLYENFWVHTVMRDTRGDWGDDGGYLFALVTSEKDSKDFKLIATVINYNLNLTHLKVTGELGEGDFFDYFECNSMDAAEAQCLRLVWMMNRFKQTDEFEDGYVVEQWGQSWDEEENQADFVRFSELFNGLDQHPPTRMEFEVFCFMHFAYYEYEADRRALQCLTYRV